MTDRGHTAASGPSVAIIGCGFGGIAAAVKMRQAGIENFTIYEREEGIGGTWWLNRFPGAEVDVASHLYSYAFAPRGWTRTHARQEELQQYLEAVVDRFDLRSHIRLGTEVKAAIWDEATATYDVMLAGGETLQVNAVVSAVGFLNIPRYPDWPGLERFQGPVFHTARWPADIDLTGKRVALVGTGSTSAQVLPAIAPLAGHVTLFQREPGWVLPKLDRDLTLEERARFSHPFEYRKERLQRLWEIEKGQLFGAVHRPSTKLNRLRESQCRAYINAVFESRPDLAKLVTPDYPFPGKRPVLSGDFYPALLRDNVELVPLAVQSVTERGLVDADGVEHTADIVVLATGFRTTDYLSSIEVRGRRAETLKDFWAGEPTAFLGITVPGFPNFSILYGPNTNGGEIVTHLVAQAGFAARAIGRLAKDGVRAVEVRPGIYVIYNYLLQRAMRGTAWVVSNNYYKSASGRVVTQWPYGSIPYRILTKTLGRISEKVTR
jgi:cation diffusion facilitator CzcD-associated flavoprotein CzcO